MTPFWSDDLDMDLLKILPGLTEQLGDAADIPLWTYGGTSHGGRLNHPAVWHDHVGMVAFFGLDNNSGSWKPANHTTFHDLVECTWLEALRDAWPHQYIAVVDNRPLWDAFRLRGTYLTLMYDLHGWRKLPPRQADKLRGTVLASVLAATRELTAVVATR